MEERQPLAERLVEMSAALREGSAATQLTVRSFLGLWGAQRRGYWIVRQIREDLHTAGLSTFPDFESAYIDATIEFRPAPPDEGQPLDVEVVATETLTVSDEPEARVVVAAYADPTFRLSKLAAANRPPTYVPPDASIRQAVTIMLANQFSQLPIMTTEREVKGVLSWRTLGSRLALGQRPTTAQEAMERAAEINADASIFTALQIIVEHDYVLVRAPDRRIAGIVTTSDISLQFQQLSESFLLLGEIENHLRRIISSCFDQEDFEAARDPGDSTREVTSAADLTFGEYRRLLEEPERWVRSTLPIDRQVFVQLLDRVRDIRNDVMHFDPDGIPPADLGTLREFARFLGTLQNLGVT